MVVPPSTRPVAGVAVPSEPNSAAASAPAPPAHNGLVAAELRPPKELLLSLS